MTELRRKSSMGTAGFESRNAERREERLELARAWKQTLQSQGGGDVTAGSREALNSEVKG